MRISVTVKDECWQTSLDQFERDNEGFDRRECEDALAVDGRYVMGGGASPVVVIEPAIA